MQRNVSMYVSYRGRHYHGFRRTWYIWAHRTHCCGVSSRCCCHRSEELNRHPGRVFFQMWKCGELDPLVTAQTGHKRRSDSCCQGVVPAAGVQHSRPKGVSLCSDPIGLRIAAVYLVYMYILKYGYKEIWMCVRNHCEILLGAEFRAGRTLASLYLSVLFLQGGEG